MLNWNSILQSKQTNQGNEEKEDRGTKKHQTLTSLFITRIQEVSFNIVHPYRFAVEKMPENLRRILFFTVKIMNYYEKDSSPAITERQ